MTMHDILLVLVLAFLDLKVLQKELRIKEDLLAWLQYVYLLACLMLKAYVMVNILGFKIVILILVVHLLCIFSFPLG